MADSERQLASVEAVEAAAEKITEWLGDRLPPEWAALHLVAREIVDAALATYPEFRKTR